MCLFEFLFLPAACKAYRLLDSCVPSAAQHLRYPVAWVDALVVSVPSVNPIKAYLVERQVVLWLLAQNLLCLSCLHYRTSFPFTFITFDSWMYRWRLTLDGIPSFRQVLPRKIRDVVPSFSVAVSMFSTLIALPSSRAWIMSPTLISAVVAYSIF